MKDFRFLMGIAQDAEEIPRTMQTLLAPFEGNIQAFHHDITARGSHFVVTYTIQLATPNVHSSAKETQPERDRPNKGRDAKSGRA